MQNEYCKISYKKLKSEEIVAHITFSGQVMAETDMDSIIVKSSGVGFIMPFNKDLEKPVKKRAEYIKEFLDVNFNVDHGSLVETLKEQNKAMLELKKIPNLTTLQKLMKTIEKAHDLKLLTKDQEIEFSNLSKNIDNNRGLKDVLLKAKVSMEAFPDRADKLTKIANEVKNPSLENNIEEVKLNTRERIKRVKP